MLFVPKKLKFKKSQKGKLFNKINSSSNNVYQLKIGSVGLKCLSIHRLTSKHFETLRQTITKTVKKSGKVIINAHPSITVSKKPVEVRMGKGKGNVGGWIFKIKPGFILCEIVTDNVEIAIAALKIIQKKLNLKSKIVFQ
jgi:large subunit ribosomal protein L16